jgi:hypothetical protein
VSETGDNNPFKYSAHEQWRAEVRPHDQPYTVYRKVQELREGDAASSLGIWFPSAGGAGLKIRDLLYVPIGMEVLAISALVYLLVSGAPSTLRASLDLHPVFGIAAAILGIFIYVAMHAFWFTAVPLSLAASLAWGLLAARIAHSGPFELSARSASWGCAVFLLTLFVHGLVWRHLRR